MEATACNDLPISLQVDGLHVSISGWILETRIESSIRVLAVDHADVAETEHQNATVRLNLKPVDSVTVLNRDKTVIAAAVCIKTKNRVLNNTKGFVVWLQSERVEKRWTQRREGAVPPAIGI